MTLRGSLSYTPSTTILAKIKCGPSYIQILFWILRACMTNYWTTKLFSLLVKLHITFFNRVILDLMYLLTYQTCFSLLLHWFIVSIKVLHSDSKSTSLKQPSFASSVALFIAMTSTNLELSSHSTFPLQSIRISSSSFQKMMLYPHLPSFIRLTYVLHLTHPYIGGFQPLSST